MDLTDSTSVVPNYGSRQQIVFADARTSGVRGSVAPRSSRAGEVTQSTLQWCLWSKLVMTGVSGLHLWDPAILSSCGPSSPLCGRSDRCGHSPHL